MAPELRSSKGGVRIRAITDKAPRRMGVERKEKWNKQVMCVPEGLEGLLANPSMRGRVN